MKAGEHRDTPEKLENRVVLLIEMITISLMLLCMALSIFM